MRDIIRIRFQFFNNNDNYTVEYMPSLKTWYVFKDETEENALYGKKLDKAPRREDITIDAADDVLFEYLETITETVKA